MGEMFISAVISDTVSAAASEYGFLDRLDPLALSDELIRHYRFPRRELIDLIREMEPHLQWRTRRVHARDVSDVGFQKSADADVILRMWMRISVSTKMRMQ